jgi:hypothetical protein
MKFWFTKALTSGCGYTSASSRTHPLHIGAALKSSSNGFPSFFARDNAGSTSLFHWISMMVGMARSSAQMAAWGPSPTLIAVRPERLQLAF